MKRVLVLLLAPAVVLAACGDDGEPVATADDPLAGIEVEEPPPASEADVATAVDGMNALGLDLLGEMPDEGNVLLGPWSITEGLALPYLGARGATATEMADVLHYDLEGDAQHAALRTLREELLSRENDELVIAAANRVFGDDDLTLTDAYLADLSRYYEAPLGIVDFAEPEAARAEINEWVSGQTNDRIPELFPADAIDPSTRLALVNATYLDASWFFPFNPENTADEPFTLLDGTTVTVPTMHFNEYLPSGGGDGWQVVQIPYTGDELSMLVIVPDDIAAFENHLDLAQVEEIRDSIEDGGIHLGLPSFELDFHTSLIEPLQELGLAAPFDGTADFSGITEEALFIDAIEHETFVKVNEEGTEAAAATGSAMAASHGPTVDVNRPFLFLIQDDATGAVLFIGRVTDPRG